MSLVLLCLSLLLLFLHITHMPYHDINTNMTRGGVYGAVTWISLASTIACNYPASHLDNSAQLRQWVMLGILPVPFVLAAALVYFR